MLVGGQDVGQVGAVQNVFESRENANPDVRAVLVVDEARYNTLATAQWMSRGAAPENLCESSNLPTAEKVKEPNPNHGRGK